MNKDQKKNKDNVMKELIKFKLKSKRPRNFTNKNWLTKKSLKWN